MESWKFSKGHHITQLNWLKKYFNYFMVWCCCYFWGWWCCYNLFAAKLLGQVTMTKMQFILSAKYSGTNTPSHNSSNTPSFTLLRSTSSGRRQRYMESLAGRQGAKVWKKSMGWHRRAEQRQPLKWVNYSKLLIRNVVAGTAMHHIPRYAYAVVAIYSNSTRFT